MLQVLADFPQIIIQAGRLKAPLNSKVVHHKYYDAQSLETSLQMNLDTIKNLFRSEFGGIADKFQIHDLRLIDAPFDKTLGAASPGVYVFMNDLNVIKVGRHLQNSRKRALEHIAANTGSKMASLKNDEAVRLVLFNINNLKDLHWVFALEVYFEQNLQPVVRSARLG